MSQSASISLIDATTAGSRQRRPLPLSELAVANRQRDALYLLSEELHQADTIQAIYDAAMDAIESALNCDRSAILLLDEAGVMQFVASRGLSAEYRTAVTGHSPWRADECGRVAHRYSRCRSTRIWMKVSRPRCWAKASAPRRSFRWCPTAR